MKKNRGETYNLISIKVNEIFNKDHETFQEIYPNFFDIPNQYVFPTDPKVSELESVMAKHIIQERFNKNLETGGLWSDNEVLQKFSRPHFLGKLEEQKREGLDKIHERANKEDAIAQSDLAFCLNFGIGVQQNQDTARTMYERARENYLPMKERLEAEFHMNHHNEPDEQIKLANNEKSLVGRILSYNTVLQHYPLKLEKIESARNTIVNSFNLMRDRAHRGDIDAKQSLAYCFSNKIFGIEHNPTLALKLYEEIILDPNSSDHNKKSSIAAIGKIDVSEQEVMNQSLLTTAHMYKVGVVARNGEVIFEKNLDTANKVFNNLLNKELFNNLPNKSEPNTEIFKILKKHIADIQQEKSRLEQNFSSPIAELNADSRVFDPATDTRKKQPPIKRPETRPQKPLESQLNAGSKEFVPNNSKGRFS